MACQLGSVIARLGLEIFSLPLFHIPVLRGRDASETKAAFQTITALQKRKATLQQR